MDSAELLRILSGLTGKILAGELPDHRLILLGGTHGVGKTTLCEKIKRHVKDIEIVTASGLLNWCGKEKLVDDIPANQSTLIPLINDFKNRHHITLLDGHFSVPDKQGNPQYIGNDILDAINPDMLFLLEADADTIVSNLLRRDNRRHDPAAITRMATAERAAALTAARHLTLPLHVITSSRNLSSLRPLTRPSKAAR